MSRPEHQAPPEIVSGTPLQLLLCSLKLHFSIRILIFSITMKTSPSNTPTSNQVLFISSHIIEVQQFLTERAFELLNLQKEGPLFLLDLGCGSGLSGEVLSEFGHLWVGLDVSRSMLGRIKLTADVAKERQVEGDLFLQDLGQGLGFRPGAFDGAISISAIQWLCNADKSSHSPKQRLMKFFSTLYSALARGSRAVFQFYPENTVQIELITNCALRCGFSGGVVIDFPNSTKAKKYYLVLMVGCAEALPAAKTDENDQAAVLATQRPVNLIAGRIEENPRDVYMTSSGC
jgi:18S rRNA (guanine1575-N7)-methyltransferase